MAGEPRRAMVARARVQTLGSYVSLRQEHRTLGGVVAVLHSDLFNYLYTSASLVARVLVGLLAGAWRWNCIRANCSGL